ncbi:4'-phosphopantetheinyl transferase family protein [Bacillus sp. NPDC077027]|uniref:4'-phosphopantetheinyl transferase family protein n=1 Tax=Bacillus sp. NPDC077027 TaxID=3390548 RepID=UPI003CFBCB24
MKIYAIRLQLLCEEEELEQIQHLKRFVSEQKRKAAERFRFPIDARRTLIGEVLIRQIVQETYQIPSDQIVFETEENGKPIIAGLKNFHFNLSHSGHFVVCAVSDKPVGIDIEQVKPIDLDIAKRFFSPQEYADLLTKSTKDQIPYFFHLWSMKESFIKLTGKGLSYGLSSFSAHLTADGQASFNLPEGEPVCYVKAYDLDPAYKMAACSSESALPDHIELLTCHDILSAT